MFSVEDLAADVGRSNDLVTGGALSRPAIPRNSQVSGALEAGVGGGNKPSPGIGGAADNFVPEPSVDLFASVRGKDLSNLTNKEIGDVGEDIARLFLKDNNFTDVFSIQNGSGNGIDIVARSPDGSLVFIEVKTSRTNAVGDLSPRQQSMDFFVEDVLTQAATKTGRYKNISAADQMLAEEMLMNFNMRPDQVRGNVVGIDLSGEMLRISPWARK
nr:YraN family protein [Stenotrophomonas sp. SY1]